MHPTPSSQCLLWTSCSHTGSSFLVNRLLEFNATCKTLSIASKRLAESLTDRVRCRSFILLNNIAFRFISANLGWQGLWSDGYEAE